MPTRYVCPNCGNNDATDFRARYVGIIHEPRDYAIKTTEDDDCADIIETNHPETDWESDADYGETETQSEEFQRFLCTNCDATFGSFEEEEYELESEKEAEETLPSYLTNCNTCDVKDLRKALSAALADEDLVLSSKLMASISLEMKNHQASLEALQKLFEQVKERTYDRNRS